MFTKTRTIWITKEALQPRGIYTVTATISDDWNTASSGIETYTKPHWHTSRLGALKRAEDMRKKKLRALKATVTRIRRLDFNNAPRIENANS